jgi:hypothetical protein
VPKARLDRKALQVLTVQQDRQAQLELLAQPVQLLQ